MIIDEPEPEPVRASCTYQPPQGLPTITQEDAYRAITEPERATRILEMYREAKQRYEELRRNYLDCTSE